MGGLPAARKADTTTSAKELSNIDGEVLLLSSTFVEMKADRDTAKDSIASYVIIMCLTNKKPKL